jgi:hypothetical protein
MAKVQISWRDNSNNEEEFLVYKGASDPVSNTDDLIATVALSGTTWGVSGTASNVTLTSTNTGDSLTTGETFTITYDEATPGTYYYGVAASNAVGASSVVTSTGSVEVLS